MLFCYRWRCESWHGGRGNHDGSWSGNHDDLRGRGVEGLDDPVDRQVCYDNSDEGSNRYRKDLLDIHLSFATTEQSQMQTNPLHFEEDARIDAIYRVIKGNLNWDNLVPTLLEAAGELEAMPGLQGKEKLELLQKALKHALKESDKSAEEKERIVYTIDVVVPVAVQALVMASKNPMIKAVANQVEAVCIGCWTKK